MSALTAARARALRDSRPCTVTEEDMKEVLLRETCEYCGIRTQPGRGIISVTSATIDVIDPGLGYVVGNLALSCQDCNRSKGDYTPRDLRRLANQIDFLWQKYSHLRK